MGTNFYAHTNVCKCCNRPEEKIHIGKSSMGWTFSFHAVDEYDGLKIRSFKDWAEFLCNNDCKIFDEYDREISRITLFELIELKKKELNNHAEQHPEGCFLDEDGNSFSTHEFC